MVSWFFDSICVSFPLKRMLLKMTTRQMLTKPTEHTLQNFITTIKRSRRSGGTVILEEEANVGRKASNRKEDSLIVCRYDSILLKL